MAEAVANGRRLRGTRCYVGALEVPAPWALPPHLIWHNLGITQSGSGYFGVSGGRNGLRSLSYRRTSEQYILAEIVRFAPVFEDGMLEPAMGIEPATC